MNGAALRSDWPPAGEATPTPRGAVRGERGLAGGAPFTNAVEQRSGRAGPVGAGPRGGRAGPGPHGAAPPRAPRGPRALRAGSGQAPTRAELLSRVFSRPGAAALGPASHSKFGGRLLSRTAAAIAALPLLLRISAAGSRPGPPPVPRRCPRRMKGYLDQQVPFTFPQVSGGSAGGAPGWLRSARGSALSISSLSSPRVRRGPVPEPCRERGRVAGSRERRRCRTRKVSGAGAEGGPGVTGQGAGPALSPRSAVPGASLGPLSASFPFILPRRALPGPAAAPGDVAD